MSSQKADTEDQEFEAFMQGRSELSRRLQQIPQPAPSDALSAAILAQAEQASHNRVPANDVRSHDSAAKVLQISSFQRVTRRFTVPLALAAGLLIAVTAGVQWRQHQSQETPLVAQRAEPPQAGAATATNDAASAPLATAPAPAPAKSTVPGGDMLAQADTGAATGSTVVRSGPAASSATTATPSGPAAKEADDKAQAWLLLIDGLINNGMRQDALDEWTEFRKKYPDYAVADALKERIRTLATIPQTAPAQK